jgi:hypothetical protein
MRQAVRLRLEGGGKRGGAFEDMEGGGVLACDAFTGPFEVLREALGAGTVSHMILKLKSGRLIQFTP